MFTPNAFGPFGLTTMLLLRNPRTYDSSFVLNMIIRKIVPKMPGYYKIYTLYLFGKERGAAYYHGGYLQVLNKRNRLSSFSLLKTPTHRYRGRGRYRY